MRSKFARVRRAIRESPLRGKWKPLCRRAGACSRRFKGNEIDVCAGNLRGFGGRPQVAPTGEREAAMPARKVILFTERFFCVILSEGGEAAAVEPVGRLGRGGISSEKTLLSTDVKILFASR